jgi:hypothetical protein
MLPRVGDRAWSNTLHGGEDLGFVHSFFRRGFTNEICVLPLRPHDHVFGHETPRTLLRAIWHELCLTRSQTVRQYSRISTSFYVLQSSAVKKIVSVQKKCGADRRLTKCNGIYSGSANNLAILRKNVMKDETIHVPGAVWNRQGKENEE